MKTMIQLVLAGIMFTSAQALAKSLVIQCPDPIALKEVAKSTHPKWEVTADKGKIAVSFESILLYDGHPREMASLKPDDESETPGRLVATWNLPKAEPDRGYWVGCAYRNSMTLLTKRLPDTVSTCRYTQKRLRSGELAGVESFVCR